MDITSTINVPINDSKGTAAQSDEQFWVRPLIVFNGDEALNPTVYVDGNEVYAKRVADAIESDLQPLILGKLITRLSKYDTNPANNPQVPGQHRD